MSKYKVKLELYTKHKENVERRNKLDLKRTELASLIQKQAILPVQQDLETTKNCLKHICECQEKINNRKASTLIKFQDETKKIFDKDNVIVLPQKNHKDLQNIIDSKVEIENLISSLQEKDECCGVTEYTALYSINNCNVWNKQLANDIQTFRSMEGLYNNVINLKKLSQDKKDTSLCEKTEDESDLGCYPHENVTDSSNNLVTSSPISSMKTVFYCTLDSTKSIDNVGTQ